MSTSGSIYDSWIKNCFKDTTFQVVASPSAGVLAVKNGQADAFMYDDAFLVGVAANDRDLKMTTHRFLNVPWGIGIRKGEADMKRWVDAAIKRHAGPRHVLEVPPEHDPAAVLGDLQGERPEPEGQAPVPAREPAREQLPHLDRRLD